MKTARLSHRVHGLALVFGCMAMLSSHAGAQQREAPELRQELAKLAATADSLEHSLPNFACREEVVSELLAGKKVKKHVEFTAEIRTRKAGNGVLDETFTLQTVNGKPVTKQQSSDEPPYVRFNLPVYVKGGFDHAMSYFASERQECYRFKLSSDRIDFETAADIAVHPQCRDDQLHGFALLDGQGNVVHIERRVSDEAAREFRLAPLAAIDFAPVDLNNRTFWLSSHLLAEYPAGSRTARFRATYTGCRLFAATVTIGPATAIPQQQEMAPHP